MIPPTVKRVDRRVEAEPLTPSVPLTRLFRFSVDEYEGLIRERLVRQPERLELLDGWIVVKMTHNPRHDSAVYRLQRRLTRLLAEEWIIRIQSSISLPKSVPEPDVVVVPGPEERYDRVRPAPKDVPLLVEVADSTLDQDQGFKQHLYARARIAVYWIINLVDNQIEVHTSPRGGKNAGYRQVTIYMPGERVPVVLNGETVGEIPARELLP
jgi:Uma2 family endonuclease